jgi:hypothetical protein
MADQKLKEAVDNECKSIIESMLFQAQKYSLKDLRLEMISLAKMTFKELCEYNGQDYKKVIKDLKEQDYE